MNIKITTIFLLIISAITQITAGSIFTSSSQGIGIKRYTVDIRGVGMGGTGLASLDSLGLSNYTLSKWRFINDTRATLGFMYSKTETELTNINFSTATTYMGNFNLAIPIKTHKVLVGLSLSPYSYTDFKYIMTIQDQGLTYDETVFLRGNITKAQFGLIWSPISKIGISVNGNYYFGNLKDQYQLTFNNSNYFNSFQQVEYQIRGPGIGLSLDFSPNKKLMFAGFIDFEPSIKLKRNTTAPFSEENREITNSGSFPMHFGIGSSYRVHPQLIFSMDYSAQKWSEGLGIKQFSMEGLDVVTSSRLDDWYHFGIGIERNAKKSRNAKFFNLIDLRTGFSLTSLGYKFNNEPVIQYAGHFGLGIPFSGTNRFDIAIVGGIRGDKSKNLVEEKFINFEFSVTMGELWFQKLR